MKALHPAPYTPAIADLMVEWLADLRRGTLIDPFAGLGQHLPKFVAPGRRVIGYELEEPWVDVGNDAIRDQIRAGKIRGSGKPWWPIDRLLRQGDATRLPHRAGTVAAIFTSPSYGGRFADHHNAQERCSVCRETPGRVPVAPGSRKTIDCAKCGGTGRRNHTRRGYTHDIRAMTGDPGYTLHANNSGAMHYGPEYQAFHRAAYREFWRVARPPKGDRPGCRFLLNVSDIVRDKKRINAAVWHLATCVEIGWEWRRAQLVPTPRMRYGTNREARVDGEWVYELRKPEAA